MERLTRKDIYGDTECIRCFTKRCMLGCVNCEAYIDVIERLRAYEDAGLMPEQVEEIKNGSRKTEVDLSKRENAERVRVCSCIHSREQYI